MPLGEGLAAGVYVALGGSALAAAGWRLAGRLVGADAFDRAFAALVVALGGLCAAILALGIAGLLTYGAVLAALLVGSGFVLWRVAPLPTSRGRLPDGTVLAATALGGLVAGLAVAFGLQGVSSSVDTFHYHVPNAGTWLHEQSLLTLPIAAPGFTTNAYPSDHTLTALWLMLATGADHLAYVVNVAWGAFAVLAGGALARALGGRASLGALLALGVVVSPISFSTHAAAVYSDLAAAAGVTAGAAAALRAARDEERRTGWAIVAGIALGLAVGSKYTAFAAAPFVVLLPLALRGRRGLGPAVTIVAAAAPLVLFWLVRDAVEFGNPLFPQSLGPLEGSTSPLTAYETPIAKHLLEGNGEVVSDWLRLIRDLAGFAFLLPLAAVPAAVVAWRRRRRALGAVAVLVAVSFAAYLITPFTGGGDEGLELLIGSQLRYALPALLLAAPLVALAGRGAALVAAAAMLVFGAVDILDNGSGRSELDVDAVAVVAALAGAALALALARLRPPVLPLLAAAAVLVAGGTAVALREQAPRSPTATERLLAGCQDPVVGVTAAQDVRALMGRELTIGVVAIDEPADAGRRPILDPARLDRAIDELGPDLVASQPGPTQAAGWDGPPGWRALRGDRGATLYAPPGGCARG